MQIGMAIIFFLFSAINYIPVRVSLQNNDKACACSNFCKNRMIEPIQEMSPKHMFNPLCPNDCFILV